MIYVNYIGDTLILIGAGIIVVVLAIITAIALRRNNLLERYRKLAKRALEDANAAKTALKEQVDRLQETNTILSESLTRASQDYNLLAREHRELEARTIALQKTLEAQPTAPKRAVPKRGTQAAQEGV